MTVLILGTIAWGALSFGAVYPWAYWPLLASLIVVGILAWRSGAATGAERFPIAGLAFGIIALGAAIQLVPLPSAILRAVSPATDAWLNTHNVAYGARVIDTHPLSVVPSLTRLAFFASIALGVFAFGTARWMSRHGVSAIADGVLVLGVMLAMIAIVQKASLTDRIYGFWTPQYNAFHFFGPFVNRNHFGGWMLMALAVAIGSFCARLTAAMRGVRSDWRSRALWLSTPDANQLLLRVAAIVMMGTSMVLTLSRSAVICFTATLVMFAVVILVKGFHRTRRGTLALAVLLSTALLVAGAVGVDQIIDRFSAQPPLAGRMGAWRIAVQIVKDFPVTGTGMNTFDVTSMFYQSPPPLVRWFTAHNDYLQLAADGGLLITVPFGCAVMMMAKSARDRFRGDGADETTSWIRVGAAAGIAGIAMQEFVDFSLQLPGIAALFSLLCAIVLHSPPVRAREMKR